MTIAHSVLTGAALHEPKGIATATSGTVYVADGAGTGAWSSVSALVGVTGMIADFAVPIAPTGWLECDGSAVSRTTYADLFTAVTIQQSGTRTSGTKIITGLSSTTNMRVGFIVGGSGIVSGSVIVTVDSATQITLDQNATSSGTSTVIVSPWGQGDGATNFNVPNAKKRYRRGRDTANNVQMGAAQADIIKNHVHPYTPAGTVSNTFRVNVSNTGLGPSTVNVPPAASDITNQFLPLTGSATFDGTPANTSNNTGGDATETRPITVVVMTCIKT